jgi:ACS family hexuronate transporter-like MFS transporter
MLQPLCGYVLDVIGLKRGYALFAVAWSLISMGHGLAHNWQMLAGLRGLLGLAEGSANPAGMKATAEWFPAKERGLAGGVYNIGASFGSMLAPPLVAFAILQYNWQSAFVITGALGLVWVALWLWLYHPPEKHPRSRRQSSTTSPRGRRSTCGTMELGLRCCRCCGGGTSGASRYHVS